jgi:hypothetical protein
MEKLIYKSLGFGVFLIAKFLARAKKRELYSREQNYEDHTYDT